MEVYEILTHPVRSTYILRCAGVKIVDGGLSVNEYMVDGVRHKHIVDGASHKHIVDGVRHKHIVDGVRHIVDGVRHGHIVDGVHQRT